MINKKILEKITELQKAILWLENEAKDGKSRIFYLEHLGPIYRMITNLKKEVK